MEDELKCNKSSCKKCYGCNVIEPKNVTEIAYEMSGTIVVTQWENGNENEVYLCKEDIAKIMNIALTSDIASKKEFE